MDIQQLLQQPRIWRGRGRSRRRHSDRFSTGWERLDAELPQGGWLPGALTEILAPARGLGELSLVLPALGKLTRAGRRMVCISPSPDLYPPALAQHGVAIEQVILIRAGPRESLWATEQCLRSGCCAAVLCWPDPAPARALRRLQLAAEKGASLGFVFRPEAAARTASPAATRLLVTGRNTIRILKCRGGFSRGATIAFAS